ncbi:hypothetical protein HZB89_01315 [archaeon]|nr:hypothetical protein [archaeon]
MKEIAVETEGYSGADIAGLIREAALIALKESALKDTKVRKKHVLSAMKKVLPSIPKEITDAYSEFREKANTYKPSYIG